MFTTTVSRIIILILSGWFLLLACENQPTPSQEPASHLIFVGTGNGEEDNGIFTIRFFPDSGSFMHVDTTALLNPTFLTISPDKQYLYSIHSVKGQPAGGVSSFRINTDGSLNPVSQQSSEGNGPCYISTGQTGKWCMVANYGSGSVAVLPLNANGSLEPASNVQQHQGSSIDPQRQEGPHAHYIRQAIGGNIFAADLGTDKVMIYKMDEERGVLSPAAPAWIDLEAGAGPRHIDYHPNEKYVYVMNELAGSVSVFDASQGFAHVQTVSSLPDTFSGNNKSADIHMHPNGRFLYASNRGDFNSIAIFSVDETSGMLTAVGYQHEGIMWPRNFAIDPSGKYLLSANRDDNSITSFLIDPQTGLLSPTGYRIAVPRPMCIQFL